MGHKVFITGVGGYLGGVVAAHLATVPGIDCITGVDNRLEPLIPLPSKVDQIRMDIRSPELAEVMAGHDCVIHCAFIVQWLAKMPAAVRDDINLNGTRNVAEAAIQNHVQCFLHASSIAAYDPAQAKGKSDLDEQAPIGDGKSQLYYWDSKANSERLLARILGPSRIPLTYLRMTYIIGPHNQSTIQQFRESAVMFPGHNPRIQFVHEHDVARAFEHAIRMKLTGAYNVVPDDFLYLSDVYQISGAKPMHVPVWLACLIASVRWRYFNSLTHPSWIASLLCDDTISNAKLKASGWSPQYTCPESVRASM